VFVIDGVGVGVFPTITGVGVGDGLTVGVGTGVGGKVFVTTTLEGVGVTPTTRTRDGVAVGVVVWANEFIVNTRRQANTDKYFIRGILLCFRFFEMLLSVNHFRCTSGFFRAR
jgi:hypothetical protein